MKGPLVWLLAIAVFWTAGSDIARAQVQFDENGMPGIIVSFGDLDLGRANDRELLRRRIRSAIQDLCGQYGERTISIVADIQRCRTRTLASADDVITKLVAGPTRSNLGSDGARLAFSPCHVGRGRILWCEVRSILSSGMIKSRPSETTPTTLAPGFTALGDVGHVYRPPNLPSGPSPLIVLLHGAGDDARRFLEMLTPIAEEGGYVMAAAKSLGPTWDIAAEISRASYGTESRPDFGADVPRIDAMLRETFARTAIDPRQVVLVGYSDGASYALSLALANSDVFPSVIALSPGFVKFPPRLATGQRIFIAHGTHDSVIPFETAQRIADELSSKQLPVRFRPFDGGHGLSRLMLLEGLDSVLMLASERRGEGARAGADRSSLMSVMGRKQTQGVGLPRLRSTIQLGSAIQPLRRPATLP